MKLSRLFLAVAFAAPPLSALPAQVTATSWPELFRDAPAERSHYETPVALRQRNAGFELGLLGPDTRAATAAIAINLFPDTRVHAFLDRVEPAWGGGHVWVGHVAGRLHESVIFSVFEDALTGTVTYHDRVFQIHSRGDSVVTISEVDPVHGGGCAVTDEHHVGHGEPEPEPLPGASGRAGSPDIHVLVVYTTRAKNANGGVNGMNSLINLGVTETNDAYSTSQVAQRIVLAHSAEMVGYNENGNFSTELNRLTNGNDGYMDEAHTLRNQYNADIVTQVVGSASSCGIAWLMTTVNVGFANSAFNVVADGCFTGYYSFGHELGHNMGSHHDRQNGSGAAYAYSYGYRTGGSPNYRTIMAYSPGTRVKRFSNPNITYGNKVMGVAYPASNSAENWRSLTNTANVVHRFRDQSSPTLKVPKLNEGASTSLKGENLTANGAFYVAYSLNGGGPVNTAWGQANLTPPYVTLPPATANGSGNAEIFITIPTGTQGTHLWFHGLDVGSGTLTNGMSKVID